MVAGLAATGLVFAYRAARDTVRAIDGVSFALTPGELCCVLGPNGAGKSTLLALLAGIRRPDAGRVAVDGADVRQLSPRRRARSVALVPQALDRVPALAVRDFVLGGRYAHLGPLRSAGRTDRTLAADALDEAGVAGARDRLLGELSGGEFKRVLIARALAQHAPIVLLDEPTASLDPVHALEVVRLARRLADGGRAIAVVTHDLNLAGQFADRIVLLDAGRVAAEGAPREVLCESVMVPVYGAGLFFGTFPDGAPLVLPRRAAPGAG